MLSDQLRRALLSAYLQTAEGAHRNRADRLARFRGARGEAGEAAAALEGVDGLALGQAEEVGEVLECSTAPRAAESRSVARAGPALVIDRSARFAGPTGDGALARLCAMLTRLIRPQK